MVQENILDDLVIKTPTCVGDTEHNEYINTLTKDVLLDPLTNDILLFVKQSMGQHRWVFNCFTKAQVRLLNTICRTKASKKSLLYKRILNFYSNLLKQYQNMALLLNKDKINGWKRICKKYGVEI